MLLIDALEKSPIEAAEVYCCGETAVVGNTGDGYEVSFNVGNMSPYFRKEVWTVEEAEMIVTDKFGQNIANKWEPRED